MTTIKHVPPLEIETQSFAIIEREFQDQTGLVADEIDAEKFQIIRRSIASNGEFGIMRARR